ncbi:MAG: J domain-containing protein [Spirochaetota bacterium]|jgi:hypothetical protein|nr:J domain-containing protein [Spirochaetota bacterium]
MRRVKHCLAVIAYWRGKEVCDGLREEARLRRIRISGGLKRSILREEFRNKPNDLLRRLAREIQDRGFLSMLYTLYDQRERALQAEGARRSNTARKRARTLEEKFLAAGAGRYISLREALLEEARLRKLDLPEDMLRDHCHIFKKYFDWSTGARLEKILALDEQAFHQRVYAFAGELAAASGVWAHNLRFDWRRFRYAGFERADTLIFISERERHLLALGLDTNADPETIRKRYIELAKLHHPDSGGERERMRELNAAYGFLMKEDKQP